MSEKRLVINLNEILHLEIYCTNCKNPAILPLEDQPKTPERQPGSDVYLASYKCPSCLKPFNLFTEGAGVALDSTFQNAVDTIRRGLALHRQAQGHFAIRFVIQQ